MDDERHEKSSRRVLTSLNDDDDDDADDDEDNDDDHDDGDEVYVVRNRIKWIIGETSWFIDGQCWWLREYENLLWRDDKYKSRILSLRVYIYIFIKLLVQMTFLEPIEINIKDLVQQYKLKWLQNQVNDF